MKISRNVFLLVHGDVDVTTLYILNMSLTIHLFTLLILRVTVRNNDANFTIYLDFFIFIWID